MFSKAIIAAATLALGASSCIAGSHTVTVNNNCGENLVMQVPGFGNINQPGGGSWTYNGDVRGAIASVGNNCSIDGVGCTSGEFALVDGVSSADITLIPDHVFNHPLTITLTNGESKTCSAPGCPGAFPVDGNDQLYQIQESNNPNSGVTLTFC